MTRHDERDDQRALRNRAFGRGLPPERRPLARLSAALGAAVALLAAPAPSQAQPNDVGSWYMYYGQRTVAPGWSLWGEAQYRTFDGFDDMEQLLLRTAVNRHLAEGRFVVSSGYGFVRSEPYGPEPGQRPTIDEHRIYQQLLVPQRLGRVALTHRVRFEQRWVESDFRTRGRYFLSAALPLNRDQIEPGAVYLTAYNEIFLNTSGVGKAFDRNRLYGGLGIGVAPGLSLQLGVMRQSVRGPSDRTQFNVSLHHSM